MPEAQVIDTELNEAQELNLLATDTPKQEPSDTKAPVLETAPQCAGCHRRGIELALMENGKRYCERCAQEVERLMGIGPLFPSAAHKTASGSSPSKAALADALSATEGKGTLPSVSHETATPPLKLPDPKAPALTEAEQAAAHAEMLVSVARTNREAADLTHIGVLRPAIKQAAAINEQTEKPEEQPLMERVKRQITTPDAPDAPAGVQPPPPPSAAAPSPAASAAAAAPPPPTPAPAAPTDFIGALSAEQERLQRQREELEARFHADIAVIDERLLHVESLIGNERTAAAS